MSYLKVIVICKFVDPNIIFRWFENQSDQNINMNEYTITERMNKGKEFYHYYFSNCKNSFFSS